MNSLHLDFLNLKKMLYFLGLSLLLIGLSYIIQNTFYNSTIFYNTYAEQLTAERTQKMYDSAKKWQWLSFILMPLLLFFKICYNSFWLTTGSLLTNDDNSFKKCYNVSLKAEYIFVLLLLVKFIWLMLFKPVNNLQDLGFMPGSVLNLFDSSKVSKWLIYPLQTINIWEVLFCAIGTSMYSIEFNISKTKAAKLFCIPYLIGLFIWILIVVFITLQLS